MGSFGSALAFPLGGDDVELTSTPASFLSQLVQLLPPGVVWNLEPSSRVTKTLQAVADELSRIEDRGRDLVEETDPRAAFETLEDWERVLALPDKCIQTIPSTPAARRLAITQKLIQRGGQSAALYIALAAACGYTATVADDYGPTVLRAGFRAGARCYGVAWAYVWRMDVSPPSGTTLTHTELEYVITRAAPSHTIVLFNYL